MKKHYIAFLLFFGTIASAQVINFPDPEFKAHLVNQGIDLNADGEIEVSEAEQFNSLYIYGNSLTSVEGLQYFVNLESLNITMAGSLLQMPDISAMTVLNSIDISNSGFTSLAIINPSVDTVTLYQNAQLTAVEVNSPQLDELSLTDNAVSVLSVGPASSSMLFISLMGNQFTSLSNLQLDPSNSYYHLQFEIDTPVLDLNEFMVHGSTLIISSPTMTEMIWRAGMHLDWEEQMNINGPQLTFADFKNNYFDASWSLQNPDWQHEINVSGHPSMAICVDDMDIGSENPEIYPARSEALYFQLLESNAGNPVPFVSPYCDQISGSNTIAGTVQINCGTSPSSVSMMPVTISGAAFNHATATSATGNYTLFAYEENVTITPDLANAQWFAITPSNYQFDFDTPGNTVTADFCVSPVGVHPDLEVTILPLEPARPGFDARYKIVYRNKGNQILNGSVVFNYDESLIDYTISTQTPDAQAPGTVSWDYQDLAPFQSRDITVTLNINSPTETPAVNIGDQLVFLATASPSAGDETPGDNTHEFNQTVVGSFDPNDKQVLEGESVSITQSGEYLHYIVRFQNTGTFMAENVTIKDVLSDKLDVGTLQVIGASHDFRTAVSHGRQVEFFFEGINLPASQDDEPASHGFVAFKVKPVDNVVVGDVIENTAEIYFDFNLPIITNTVSTEFTVLSVAQHHATTVSIVPNPASTYFMMDLAGDRSATISNMLGQKVANFTDADPSGRYDISQLPAGTYIVSTAAGSARLVIR